MKKIIFLLLIIISILACNKQPKVTELKTENDLILKINESVRTEYYNWFVEDNTIINFDKHIKIIYQDTLIQIVSLDNYNVQKDILVNLNFNTSSKQMNESWTMLLAIQHRANVTKLIKKLD